MSNLLHDPVPLGVAGSVTIPLQEYLAHVGRMPEQDTILLDDTQRFSYLALRLSEALNRPLTSPGSESLAQLVLQHFQSIDVISLFSEKAMETLRDGERHDRTALSPNEPRVAVFFVAWYGTHREVQSQRFGNYLQILASIGMQLVQMGFQLAGILEIDAYLRDNPDPNNPGRSLDEVFQIDVEYSYLPGYLLGSSESTSTRLPRMVLLNPDLCSPEEQQLLRKFIAPQG
jgi:hypothetical protein